MEINIINDENKDALVKRLEEHLSFSFREQYKIVWRLFNIAVLSESHLSSYYSNNSKDYISTYIPLDNSFKTSFGKSPSKLNICDDNFTLSRRKLFKYVPELGRSMFIADGSSLIYNINTYNSSTIDLKIIPFACNESERYVFCLGSTSIIIFGVKLTPKGIEIVNNNGTIKQYLTSIPANQLSRITISYAYSIVSTSSSYNVLPDLKIRLKVNNIAFEEMVIANTIKSSILYMFVGTEFLVRDNEINVAKPLYGLIGDIAINGKETAYSDMNAIRTRFSPILVKSYQDMIGRPYRNVVTNRENEEIISKTYNYKKNNEYDTKIISHEAILINQIVYTSKNMLFDSHNRLTKYGDRTFIYDYLGYLISDSKDNTSLIYDHNGNISKKISNGITNIYIYVEDNRLIEINSSQGKISITYDSDNKLYPSKIVRLNNEILNFDYRGKRLSSVTVNNNQYKYSYDDTGRRWLKELPSGEKIYYHYDGDTLKSVVKPDDYSLQYTSYNSIPLMVTYHKGNQSISYFYLQDITGEIIALVDEYGSVVVEYEYDTFGVPKVKKDTTSIGISSLDPIRYKGYFYDKETKLYYLSTRYYDPSIGRFISPDSINYLDPKSYNGLNLYAYCQNDPINKYDPTGHFALAAIIVASLLFTFVGGVAFQLVTSILSYVCFLIASIWNEDVRNDMEAIRWNPFNSDEKKVLNSKSVSFYHGIPVSRSELDRSGSFGVVFLNKDPSNDDDTVKHEFGHNIQLMIMGPVNYAMMIALPSWKMWSKRSEYYNTPWEITADTIGGVTSRIHSKNDVDRGIWYLLVSTLFGPMGYFFLIGEY